MNPLGEFLRARRERVDPAALGLRTVGPRRTPGLRREELASLAGISVEYLIRLERGRDRNPSAAVVASLADVLGLDDAARDHLATLADVRLDVDFADEVVVEPIRALMGQWTQPAIVMNRFMDLLAVNAAAVSMHSALGLEPGDNMVRTLFFDSQASSIYPDFEDVAAESVANLRSLTGGDIDHPRLRDLVGELSLHSPLFAEIWARNDVQVKSNGTKKMILPDVGMIELRWDTLEVSGARGQCVVVYQPIPGTGSAEKLAALDTAVSGSGVGRVRPAAVSTAKPSRDQYSNPPISSRTRR